MTGLEQFLRDRYDEQRAQAERGYLHAPDLIDYEGWDKSTVAGLPPAVVVHVLADLDAKVAILDEVVATPHEADHADGWYSCATVTEGGGACLDDRRAGGPCDCGRDAQVERRLRILVRPFAGHVEFKGEWAA